MEAWALLWKCFLVFAIAVFAGMAVWVTIGGVGDIRRLFQRLSESAHRMRLDLACPHCGAAFRVTVAEAGLYARCRTCGAIVRLEHSRLLEGQAILVEAPREGR